MKTFLKRLGVGVIIIIVFLAIAAAAFYGIENWRGKRAWERCKAELEARGEKLDAKDFVPPPIPDDQNFAASPLFQPLFEYMRDASGKIERNKSGEIEHRDQKAVDHLESISIYDKNEAANHHPPFGNWQKGKPTDLSAWQAYYQKTKDFPHPVQPQDAAHDVLFALAKYDPEIALLEETAKRPYSRFPIDYYLGAATPFPHLTVLMNLGKILELRASAHLAFNQTNAAMNDIRLELRLASSLNDENILVSYLVKATMVQATLQPIWEGLSHHQWTPSQLAELSRQIQQFDFLKDFQQAMRGERALFFNQAMAMMRRSMEKTSLRERWEMFFGWSDAWRKLWAEFFDDSYGFKKLAVAPEGWVYQEQAFQNRFIQDDIFPQVDDAHQRIHKELRKKAMEKLHAWEKTYYDRFVGKFLGDSTDESVIVNVARTQTNRDLALTAIALEQYRLANHDLPATLAALSPQFLAHVPHDVMNGQPLKYRRESNDRYALYSVGWNEIDDGGKLAFQNKKIDFNEGDWLWPMAVAPSR